jgi:hypothetical protein
MVSVVSSSSSPCGGLEIKVAVVGAAGTKATEGKATSLKALDGLLRSNHKSHSSVHTFQYVSDDKLTTTTTTHVHDLCGGLTSGQEEDYVTTAKVLSSGNDSNGFFESFRSDTAVNFVVVPGLGGANITTSREHSFLKEHWETFDCVLIVADPFNEDEKIHYRTIHFIQQLLTKRKKIPTMLLCHYEKTPGIGLEEGRKRIARLEEKVRSCNDSYKTRSDHSTVASMTIGMMSYDSDKESDDDDDDDETACHGSHSKNKNSTGSMSVESHHDDDDSAYHLHNDSELLESQWRFKESGPTSYTFGDDDDNNASMTNSLIEFFVASARTMNGNEAYPIETRLRDLIGNAHAQTEILLVQKESSLKKLKAESFFPFVDQLRTVCGRYRHVDSNCAFKDDVTFHFWDIYLKCEDGAFSRFEREMNPERLAYPLDQLYDYKSWVQELDWKDEQQKVVLAVNGLVRRQLTFVLHKNSLWSFDEWYQKMNSCGWTMGKLLNQDWDHISPSDWGTIINSLLLASSDRHFYESFGREKIALERARYISTERSHAVHSSAASAKHPATLLAADGCPTLDHALDGKYESGCFRPKYKQTFECVVRFDVPEKLSDPSHWGHLAYKHSSLVRSVM